MQSSNTNNVKHIGLSPALKRDQKIALGLSLWCLLIVFMLLDEMFMGAPAEYQAESRPGGSYDLSTIMVLIYMMWPFYVSVFLAVFMKERIVQVLWVLLAGCLPAWLLLVFASLEYLPEAIDILFFVLILFELLLMLASVVYLANFWTGWFTGKSTGPSFKAVSLQLCVVAFLLIVIGIVYS